ncbi:MAG: uL15 family ribosomal protein [Patescibacteria group bacterium]|nr:uL15 family ribosomal protein [Patescibacteria group bacterium]MDW8279566.1 uL15 family ribosomal protein [bacterium]
MRFHELKVKKQKNKKRIGRGGKRGTYSGRGQKGQKSRAGRRIRPAERDIIIRLPKLRGFKNKPNKKPKTIKITDLINKVKLFNIKDEINLMTLKQLNLVSNNYKGDVKIVGGRKEIEILPLVINGLKVSNQLKTKIIQAGGKVI